MSKTKKTCQIEAIEQQEDLSINNVDIIELNNNQSEIAEAEIFDQTIDAYVPRYKILQNCIVCNFGHKIGDVITKDQLLKCLFNDGMIINFINTKHIALY
jgi:hypothetical protein